jgi:hypothetical protein
VVDVNVKKYEADFPKRLFLDHLGRSLQLSSGSAIFLWGPDLQE